MTTALTQIGENGDFSEYIQAELDSLHKDSHITLRRLLRIINKYIPVTKISAAFDDDHFVNYIICYVDHNRINYPYDDFELTHDGLYVIGLSDIYRKLQKNGDIYVFHNIFCLPIPKTAITPSDCILCRSPGEKVPTVQGFFV